MHSFVETGTFWGDMVYANKNVFRKIFSIELDQDLYEQAKKRFFNEAHISILQGASGEIIAKVLAEINEPCLFWLDGHYSEGVTAKGKLETPIRQELKHILNHRIQGHVILIDDARQFVGQNDYPKIAELRQLILGHNPGWVFEVKDDIIRAYKNGNSRRSPHLIRSDVLV